MDDPVQKGSRRQDNRLPAKLSVVGQSDPRNSISIKDQVGSFTLNDWTAGPLRLFKTLN
jgi:hypothetical protein